MAAKRMIDFLREAETFHQNLRILYEAMGNEAEREDVRTLLTYMRSHEEAIGRCLKDYESGAARKVLDTWFLVSPDLAHMVDREHLVLSPDATPADVVTYALKVDSCLLKMYETLLGEAVSEDLKDALQNILDMERREEVKLLRSAASV